MKQFLLALATGMRPAKIYNGTDSAVEGMLLTNGDGGVLCYHKSDRQTLPTSFTGTPVSRRVR